MDSTALDRRFDFARDLARQAGGLALEHFRRRDALSTVPKGPQDMVSEADTAVEALIRERIGEAFPDDAFLGEESGGTGHQGEAPTWVVDPIDGTACFLAGLTSWCVSIALVADGTPAIGAIHDPCAGELFAARAGRPATVNGTPLQVSRATDFTAGMAEIGFSHRCSPDRTVAIIDRLLRAGGMYHRSGSGALSLAHVAAGRYIAYYEEHMNAWDSLAGVALVRGAGGWCNDVLADDGLSRGAPVAACGPELAPALRALVGMD